MSDGIRDAEGRRPTWMDVAGHESGLWPMGAQAAVTGMLQELTRLRTELESARFWERAWKAEAKAWSATAKDCNATTTNLRAELAAERERFAALAAALERYGNHADVVIDGQACPCFHIVGQHECLCGFWQAKGNASAILSAVKADQRRKGAAWALKEQARKWGEESSDWQDRMVGSIRAELLDFADAIERGQVEVPE